METTKVITISGIDCRFKTSAAVPRLYRKKFGKDIFADMQKLSKDLTGSNKDASTIPVGDLEAFENVAYIMHKHGDESQPDDIMEWLEQFNTFDVFVVLPQIIEMWALDTKQLSTPKKK